MARPDAGEIDAADQGHDLPTNVAFVTIEGAWAYASGTLVLEPTAQVLGQANSLGTRLASNFHLPYELVEDTLRLPLGSRSRCGSSGASCL